MLVLEYDKWQNFENLIGKAMIACQNSGFEIDDHFTDVSNVASNRPQGGGTIPKDYLLSRYACYLIAMNGDPTKEAIAEAQRYFATQTRKQELIEQLTDEEKRLYLRNEAKTGNKKLSETAYNSGVRNMGTFHDWGYMGLYGFMRSSQIKQQKGVKGNLLDHMGTTELAANLFRITQTDEKLKKDKVNSENSANQIHFFTGKQVRNAIEKIGGTMPEKLPPEEDIKEIEKRLKKKNQKAIMTNNTKALPKVEGDLGLFEEAIDKAVGK